DDGGVIVVLTEIAQQANAIAVGQSHVQQVSRGAAGCESPFEFLHALADGHRVAFALQDQLQRRSNVGFVIDDDDLSGHACVPLSTGKVSWKAAPPSFPS